MSNVIDHNSCTHHWIIQLVAHLVTLILPLDPLISLQPISSYNFGKTLSAAVVLSPKIVVKTKQPTINTVFEFILVYVHTEVESLYAVSK